MRRSTLVALSALTFTACPAEKKAAPPPPPAAAASQPGGAASQPGGAASQPGEAASQPGEAASQPGDEAHSKSAGSKHLDVAYEGTCVANAPCTCKGTLDLGKPRLAEIGVDEAAVAAGTPCVLGDFDGNGHGDGAFLGKGFGEAPAVDVAVLMFDDGGLMSATKLPKKVTSLTAIYSDDGAKLVEPSAKLHFVYADGVFTAERLKK